MAIEPHSFDVSQSYARKALADILSGRRTDVTRKTSGALPTFDTWMKGRESLYSPDNYVFRGTGGESGQEEQRRTLSMLGRERGASLNPAEMDYVREFYNTPNYEGAGGFLEKVLRSGPLIAAGALGLGAATGGLDQFAAGGIGSSGGGVVSPTLEAAIPAPSTGPGVSPMYDPALGGGYWDGTAAATTPSAATGTGVPTSGTISTGGMDWLRPAGTVLATGLGVKGAKDASKAYKGLGAPFTNKSLEYLNNPAAFTEGPGKAAVQGTLNALSAKFGNPIGSSAALQIASDTAMRNWLNATLGLAGAGMPASGRAIEEEKDIYTTLGGGISDLINPRRSLADLIKEGKSLGLI